MDRKEETNEGGTASSSGEFRDGGRVSRKVRERTSIREQADKFACVFMFDDGTNGKMGEILSA